MKTLYFIAGTPSTKQIALAKKADALIRNVESYHENDAVEMCDAVMGDVPSKYLKRFERSEHFEAGQRLNRAEAKQEAAKTENEAK